MPSPITTTSFAPGVTVVSIQKDPDDPLLRTFQFPEALKQYLSSLAAGVGTDDDGYKNCFPIQRYIDIDDSDSYSFYTLKII
jgi:hypothetical protein